MEQLLSAETIGLIIERAGLSILLFVLLYMQMRSSTAERKAMLDEASKERQTMIVAVVEISKVVETLKQSIQISNETDARSSEILRQNTLELGKITSQSEKTHRTVVGASAEFSRRTDEMRDMLLAQEKPIIEHLKNISEGVDMLKLQHQIFAKHHTREEKGLYRIWLELNAIKRAGASIGGAD